MIRDVTLLWALRSPCHLACRYCYFGDLEEDRLSPSAGAGQLSHLSRNDAPITDINAFLSSVGQSAVRRVFLAGGEPLNWQHALAIAEVLKDAGVEVIICTNGIPLNQPRIADQLIGLGIDAVLGIGRLSRPRPPRPLPSFPHRPSRLDGGNQRHPATARRPWRRHNP